MEQTKVRCNVIFLENRKRNAIGLIFNGLLKVPMQFFILFVGVMVFVFYQFNEAPINFNPTATEFVLNSEYAKEYKALQKEQQTVFKDKQILINSFLKSEQTDEASTISLANKRNDSLRREARNIIDKVAKNQNVKVESNDKDYVFIHFILNNLPRGFNWIIISCYFKCCHV